MVCWFQYYELIIAFFYYLDKIFLRILFIFLAGGKTLSEEGTQVAMENLYLTQVEVPIWTEVYLAKGKRQTIH